MLYNLLKLKCPKTNEPLIIKGNFLYSTGNIKYEIKNNIPVLLPDKEKPGMEYIEQYQKDPEVYDYFAERELQATKVEEKRLREYIYHKIPKNAETILDVGSGCAWLAHKAIKKKKIVISMDISYKNVSQALTNVSHSNHYGLVADALHLPIEQGQIDCIVASEVIEHVTDPELFIKNLFQSLKPGGSLIITTPYKERIKQILCIHCNKLTPLSAHLHSFDENKLINLNQSQELQSSSWKAFNNNYLNKLRLNVLLSFIGFNTWKLIDSLVNKVFRKPTRLMVIFKKYI